ncbi:MAG: HAD-IA family hydrolase [Clostridia bacterium]|nr:HAD-IA family hydrolase [Clostridia bacterium]
MQTYLFDFDGTLVDSMPVYASVMKGVLDEHHISYGDDIIKIITPLGYHDTALYFIKLGVPLDMEALLDCIRSRMVDAYTWRVPAKSNVIPTLMELKKRGCSLNILTASPHSSMDPCLKRLGIVELFDHIWSCEDFGMNKANPAIYHCAADKLGVTVGEVLFLDDNPNADKAAREAGMKVYGVYDEFTAEFADEMKRDNDGYIADFSELL